MMCCGLVQPWEELKQQETHMTNEEKKTRIRKWINPEERVTVHFLDAPDLNTTVTDCTDQLVTSRSRRTCPI